MRGIVDTVFIEDQRLRESGQLQQPMPVGVVASKSRHLEAKHDAGTPESDFADQLLETIPVVSMRAGDACIAVDRVDTLYGPAKRHGAFAQTVLALATLGVLKDLSQR